MGNESEAVDRRYTKLLADITDTVTIVDTEGAPLWTSAPLRHDLGYEPTFWDNADLFRLLHPDDFQQIQDGLVQILADPATPVHGEVRLQRPDGQYSAAAYTAVNRLDDPDIGGIVLTSRSVEAEVEVRRLQGEREEELIAFADAQSDLIASISHEMRNPLHAISGISELLLADKSLDETTTRNVTSLAQESEALRRMIDDLLDFSKAAAGRMELETSPFSPAVVADQSLTAFRAAAEKKGLRLTATIDPAVPLTVLGDAFRVRQVLMNLLSNAVKYTETGSVDLTLTPLAGGTLRFSVQDTGVGIPTEAIATIFDPYKQARRTDSKKGTGLGLAITKELVELMGSTLELSSSDSGTHFWCDLTLAEARRSTDHTQASPVSGSGMVLVVDDSEVNRMLSSSQLERLGYSPTTASGGHVALAMLETTGFDLILMDWHMPDIDGLDTTRQFREREAEASAVRTPIIAVTASAVSGDRERCLEAGMDDYLAKPVSINDLAAILNKWIGAPENASVDDRSGLGNSGVDTNRIDELVAELGDKAVVASVVGTFLTELPKWKTALVDGVAQNDLDTAKRSAHTLKSTAALLGAQGLATTCAEFEAAVDTDPEAAASMINRFVQEATDTAAELSEIHEQLQQAA